MPDTGTARCHCGGVEIEVTFPSRFCSHCYCWSCRTAHAAGVTWIGFKRARVRFVKGSELIGDYAWSDEVHLPVALFVTPVDRVPTVNSFPGERPPWAPMADLPHD